MSRKKSKLRYSKLPEKSIHPHDYFELASRTVTVKPQGYAQSLTMHYKEAGQGKPLLLVHGVWFEDPSHFLQIDAPEQTVAEILVFNS